MKKKPSSVWGVVRRYAWISLLLGWIPNLGIVTLSKNFSYGFGFVFSLISFTLVAFFTLREARETEMFDRSAAALVSIIGVFGTLMMAFAFTLSSSAMNQLPPEPANMDLTSSYAAMAVLTHWMVSNGLGFFFGLTVVGGVILLSRAVEKRKVEDFS